MRRTTKLMAAMLVLTCAMTIVPQKAEASIFGDLQALLYEEWEAPSPPPPTPLLVWNETGRRVRIRMWSNHGDYEKNILENLEGCRFSAWESSGTWFAVEAAVWNKNLKKYVVMDYVEGPAFQYYRFYKHAQGDFRLRIWD